jgi:hypothetical protein
MKHIQTYEKLKFNKDKLKSLFPTAYAKAVSHIIKMHENLTEDHIFELISHFMFNNYGIDVTHSKTTYKYLKFLLHSKFKKGNQIKKL